MRLAAIVVDYASGELVAGCVESLESEWAACGGARGELELVVIDNAEAFDASEALVALAARGVRVLRPRENLGYARAVELGRAHLRAWDALIVLNPDVYLPRGSLAPLLAHVEYDRDLGVVAPSTFVDPLLRFALPPISLPTPASEWSDRMAELDPRRARRAALARTRAALEWWNATNARDVDFVSGACFVVPRRALERLECVLDERYPLYFEDADLCRRARVAGLRVVHEPRSRVVHHWARSSLASEASAREAQVRWRASRERYFRRWHGAVGARFVTTLERGGDAWPAAERCRALHALHDLGARDRAFTIELERAALFEVALTPHFVLAAGALCDAGGLNIAPATWEWLVPARYFVRALERETLAPLGAWTFEKRSAARTRALGRDDFPPQRIAA